MADFILSHHSPAKEGHRMKRFIYVFALVFLSVCIVSPASAQILGIGVKGGLNFSTFSGDLAFDEDEFGIDLPFKNKTGFVIGASFSKGLMPLLSLQPEILYIQKGAKVDESLTIPEVGTAGVEGSFDLAYLEVPLLLRAGLPVPGLSPFVYAGPAVAFNLSAKAKLDAVAGPFRESIIDEDIKDDIKNLDYGIVLGGGMQLGLPLIKLHIEARYTIGLTNIIDADDIDFELKNRAFSLMVGVTF
jgi:hypothetical protein